MFASVIHRVDTVVHGDLERSEQLDEGSALPVLEEAFEVGLVVGGGHAGVLELDHDPDLDPLVLGGPTRGHLGHGQDRGALELLTRKVSRVEEGLVHLNFKTEI